MKSHRKPVHKKSFEIISSKVTHSIDEAEQLHTLKNIRKEKIAGKNKSSEDLFLFSQESISHIICQVSR